MNMKGKFQYLCFYVFAVLALTVITGGCIKDNDGGRDPLKEGDRLPQFTVVLNDGSSVNVPEDLVGSVSCIVFFNTACPDCREELQLIDELHSDYPQIPLLLISREEEAASIESYWQEAGLTLPYSPQKDRAVYSLFARSVIPRIYISDSKGFIRHIHTDSPLPTLEQLADELLN